MTAADDMGRVAANVTATRWTVDGLAGLTAWLAKRHPDGAGVRVYAECPKCGHDGTRDVAGAYFAGDALVLAARHGGDQ